MTPTWMNCLGMIRRIRRVEARALQYLKAQVPIGLDEKRKYPVVEEGGKEPVMKELGYSDEHKFLIEVPAWVLRIIRDS